MKIEEGERKGRERGGDEWREERERADDEKKK